ncbi:MAG: SUMF1/EgtB/PvdO family nonheme iron enzyme [Chthoniobacter sp.]|nr:SUMF1/EgtB/PvdO family nonheme iron enzyme [Chthoniobacter sp.]
MKRSLTSRLTTAAFSLVAIGFLSPVQLRGEEPKEIINSIGMKLERVEPGSFTMGQDGPAADYQTTRHAERCDQADWDERPAHRVKITTPLYFGSTEVTNAQYRQFKPGRNPKDQDDEAAIFVSWNDATKFCEWLSAKEGKTYRLPTEAEWEYACRAGTTTLFNIGDRLPDGFQKWKFNDKFLKRFFPKTMKYPSEYRDWPAEAPLRVGQTPANAWGLFDMHGNVEEWCLDWYGPFEAGEQVDPVGRVDGDFRVTRGGSHSDFTRMLRSANRSGRLPGTANDEIGFRVVLGERPTTTPLPVPPPPLNARDVSQAVPAKVEPVSKSFFSGPTRFVKVPPNLAGPMFSNHNHSPAIAECPNGDLLAVWFSCGDEGGPELAVLASRLRHGATDWDEASPFWDGPDINDHVPKLWFDGEKTLFFFAKGHAGDAMRTSTDSGATWSKAHILQPEAEIGNMPTRTREGFLLLPLDGNRLGTSLSISRDGGQTWTAEPSPRKPDFSPGGESNRFCGIHNATVQLADGRIMSFGRFDVVADQAKFHGHTPISYSSDWGKTWRYEESSFPAISTVQRAVLIRLHEGPLLLCSFTDQLRDWKQRKGLAFKAAGGTEFTGYGLFAAVSFDEGKTWPVQRLITPGGPERTVSGVDKNEFTLSDTMAEPSGYLSVCQTRDDLIQLISSKNHYVFNLAWLKDLPPAPKK